ncbi:Uma2 family endonuclease [Anseongella ginsenosidimutans]|uniref:Uma2 family endonuclease n=1 Tax=Anseongella ginsenosidimutans TaxID=496056 RepID=A0A4R3KUN5_9SPHI|nr:Uma2 family endonuclease [Anseongella ginsenosidimutans]QEC51524.1 Uma2 family endonuclease [Anseongella ginsenosidimutans]TCS88838.1 Uma2 family endonuclease [Anseongella ginsenosidimutans]
MENNEVNEAAPRYYPRMTAEEYLEWERGQEFKHEYHDGEIVVMQGAALNHNYVNMNLIGPIAMHLRDKPCDVFANDLRTEAKAANSYYYPDIAIVCGEPDSPDEKRDMICNPAVVIEVLSPSTRFYDIHRKKPSYMLLPSLKEYIMVDSTSVMVNTIRKKPADSLESGAWESDVLKDLSGQLTIPTIGLSIPLSEIYRKVDFNRRSRL